MSRQKKRLSSKLVSSKDEKSFAKNQRMFYDGPAVVESVELKSPYIARSRITSVNESLYTKQSEAASQGPIYLSKKKYNPVTPTASFKR